MYNFALAFAICALIFYLGEFISALSKAWIPSVFITSLIMLIGYWTVLPKEIITDAQIIPFAGGVGVFLLLVNLGTIISFKQLKAQWKIVLIVLMGLLGMIVFAFLLCPFFMDKSLIIAGLPPLTGGVLATTIMQQAAATKGLEETGVFAVAMFSIQGFAGYPLTSICLQKYGRQRLDSFRNSNEKDSFLENQEAEKGGAKKKKIFPPLPEKYQSPALILGKLAFLGRIATLLGTIEFPGLGKISAAVWALLLGLLANTLGLLEDNALTQANSVGFINFVQVMFIFDGLKIATPEMLKSLAGPIIALVIIGVSGMALLALLGAKIFKVDFKLAFATSLTALYGFPPNAIITETTVKALTEDEEERKFLMDEMFPAMIVGGFVSVTITSVIIAGIFTGLL